MSRTLLNVNVQPVILTVAGQKPTIPTPASLRPDQTGWLATDIMRGEVAYNSADNIYWFRSYDDEILWAGGDPVTEVFTDGNIEIDFNFPGRAEIDLYEFGNLSFTLKAGQENVKREFTKIYSIIGDDTSTPTFSDDFRDIDDLAFGYFDNKKTTKLMMFIDNGVVFCALRSMTVLGGTVPDITPPTLTSATIEAATDDVLDFVFDEAVTITTSGWSIATDGAALSISSVLSGSGTTTPKFQLSRSVLSTETLTISYDSATGNTVDLSSNELENIIDDSIVNNASIIVMQDLFTGVTIDTNKWTVTDPADDVTISQNNQLIFTTLGNNLVGWTVNNLIHNISNYPIDETSFSFSLDFVSVSGGVNKEYGISVYPTSGNTLMILQARDNGDGTTPEVRCRIVDSLGSVLVNWVSSAVDSNNKTWRLSHVSNTFKISYWNGSAWVDVHSVSSGGNIDTNLQVRISAGDNALDSSGAVIFDNANIANQTYLTQYPV